MATAQMNDATKKIREVSFVLVFARPATIGMKAFTDGVSLPKNIHHIPRRENVSWSAEWSLVKVFSSSISSFLAKGLSYFFTN